MKTDRDFELEVLRVARLLWPSAKAGGALIEDNSERDGVFVTDECVHIVECTTSTRKDKSQQDVLKITKLAPRLRNEHPTKAVKGWFITKNEPTADQRTVIQKFGNGIVVTLSHQTFFSQLIDAQTYLQCRQSYAFGSIETLDKNTRDQKFYIPSDIINDDGDTWPVTKISKALLTGSNFVLIGDYGAGKSTVMREIFLYLTNAFRKSDQPKFPILLNLRDHRGQTNPAEALERHARNIGFPSPSHLVRAWRAGYAVLLMDGFDEIAAVGTSVQVKESKGVRFRSTQLVREFIKNSPQSPGIIVSGRLHFFHNKQELNSALHPTSKFSHLTLSDFDEDQVRSYLSKKNLAGPIPEWLPTRPLLVEILARKGVLSTLANETSGRSPAEGWNILLTQISEREAALEIGIPADYVRRLIERIATKTRTSIEGIGPLQSDDLYNAFHEVCGYPPEGEALTLLQRIPGLAVYTTSDNRISGDSKVFADRDFAEAAKAGDEVRFIQNPFSYDPGKPRQWRTTLRRLGREVAAVLCAESGITAKGFSAAINNGSTEDCHFLRSDLTQIMSEMELSYDGPSLTIKDVDIHDANFDETNHNLSKITFWDCVFHRIEFPASGKLNNLPRFRSCLFGIVEGRSTPKELDEICLDDCMFEDFLSKPETTAALLGSSLPIGARVLLTILEKIYVQPGFGRKEKTLYGGLEQRGREILPDVLEVARRRALTVGSGSKDQKVWLPVREARVRALRMLKMTSVDQDDALREASLV